MLDPDEKNDGMMGKGEGLDQEHSRLDCRLLYSILGSTSQVERGMVK